MSFLPLRVDMGRTTFYQTRVTLGWHSWVVEGYYTIAKVGQNSQLFFQTTKIVCHNINLLVTLSRNPDAQNEIADISWPWRLSFPIKCNIVKSVVFELRPPQRVCDACLHWICKPCAIGAMPSQTHWNVWWWPPSYIPMGLWWHISNGIWSVSLVKMSSTDPPWWP